jgi:hypothetical protein
VPYGKCERPVVVVSDSARVLSEMQYAAEDRLAVAHCCSQAIHVSHVHSSGGFPFQEAVDLYMMGGSKKLITGIGGFGDLGRYWTGRREGMQHVVARTEEEVRGAMKMLLNDSGCEQRGHR